MLELKEVHTYYGESHILHGVTMRVEKGTVSALLGRNGMGKSTTIHSIIGFTPISSGNIKFEGIDITNQPAYKIVKTGLAIVPQGRRIFRSLNVKENLTLGWNKRNFSGEVFNPELIYHIFPVLKEKSRLKGDRISGGEQQMLAIARALLTNPKLLLMDEPFEGLAPLVIKELRQKIHELKKIGLSILLVEQNTREALKIADHVYVMNKGKIVFEGTSELLRTQDEIIKQHMSV